MVFNKISNKNSALKVNARSFARIVCIVFNSVTYAKFED